MTDMYNNEAVETITNAVMGILNPKLEQYITDRRNDISLQPEIDAVINEIEEYEDLIDNILVEGMPNISDEVFKHGVTIGGYYFDYIKETGAYKYAGDIVESAKSKIYDKHHLYNGWLLSDQIQARVAAIITTMEETDFDSIVAKIEKDIDFNEFISKQ